MSKKRNFLTDVVGASLVVAIIGSLLLLLVSVLPNTLIQGHFYSSACQLFDEGENPKLYSPVGHFKYSADNFTDSLIIQTSYLLDNPKAAMMNYHAADEGVYTQPKQLMNVADGNAEVFESYSRYWMGFRIIIRPLLIVTAYYGIRTILAAGLLLELLVAALTTAKRKSSLAAAALVVSFLLTEPYAVCASIQFSCCYILSFMFIICINLGKIEPDSKNTLLLFCFFGALTQFFDFYTYPVITLVYPLAMLCLGSRDEKLGKNAARCAFGWFASYILCWILKLLFVTVFTEENGFALAMMSVFGRFGIGEYRLETVSYSVLDAMPRVWGKLKTIPFGMCIPLLLVLGSASAVTLMCRREKRSSASVLLVLGLLPLLWMLATPQPIYIHYWFQYRSVCAMCFVMLMLVFELLSIRKTKAKSN